MEKVLTLLCKYGRLRELESRLPQLEQQLREGKARFREAELAAAQAKWERDKAEKGGLVQRLFGNQEEKKEIAYQKYREAQAAEEKEKQTVQELTNALKEAKQEKETLDGSWEKYLSAKETYLVEGGNSEALSEAAAPVLIGQALWELGECLDDLEQARPWMQADVRMTRIRADNQKLEFLGNAREHAQIALVVLEQLPKGYVEVPGYLRNPDGFIMGVAMPYKQLDRLNLAQEQLRTCRSRLKEL